MLNTIKTKGAYQGIAYDHLGPAHLSIGQESAVVGQCLPLGIEDFIFGSHRSHGEIIAKCLSAVAKLPEKQLSSIMESYMGGAAYGVVEKGGHGGGEGACRRLRPLRDAGRDLRPGQRLQQGPGRLDARLLRARSAACRTTPSSAARADISVGAALFKRINRKPGHRDRQHRRRLLGLRPRLGSDDGRRHGPVPHAVAEGRGRRAPDPVQLLQQLLRHGRPDPRARPWASTCSPASAPG